MAAIKELDLAGTWDFTPDDGVRTVIDVPGGGWFKQGFDSETGRYERDISVPHVLDQQVVRLEFGAIHHHAEYYLAAEGGAWKKVGEIVTAFTGQVLDITEHVMPGGRYRLRIDVRSHRDGKAVAPHNFDDGWPIPRGIFRSAHLRVYRPVFIKDVFVRTFTDDNTFDYAVTFQNSTDAPQRVRLKASMSAWNEGADWAYPELAERELLLDAGDTVLRFGPFDWTLPEASYWWPNIPYVKGYRAQLHVLNLQLDSGDCCATRFGFRQYRQCRNVYKLNGVRLNTMGDSFQVANYETIDCGGLGDAIDTLPGFLPPSVHNPGWPQAVDNFLRLGISSNRAHRQPWSPYMLDVCDELGEMIIGEGGVGRDERDRRHHEMKCLSDMVRRDRNHPCIVRWCMKNEPVCIHPEYMLELYEAVKAEDDTRPVCIGHTRWEWERFDPEVVYALIKHNDDFTWMDQHLSYNETGEARYTAVHHTNAVLPMDERPYGVSGGLWPHCSTQAGFVQYATMAALIRAEGSRETRPFVILSSWAGIIPGTRHDDFICEELRYPVYGEDNLPDPWSHPGIQLIQKAFHPLLAMDREFWKLNEDSNGAGVFPVQLPRIPAGERVTRQITMLNDEFMGDQLTLKWALRAENCVNPPCASGEVAVTIAPGELAVVPVSFTAPETNCAVFLALQVDKGGKKRFEDLMTCYEIIGGKPYAYWTTRAT